MKKIVSEQLDAIKEARPFARSALAFILYLRFKGVDDFKIYYQIADEFLHQLEKDVEAQG